MSPLEMDAAQGRVPAQPATTDLREPIAAPTPASTPTSTQALAIQRVRWLFRRPQPGSSRTPLSASFYVATALVLLVVLTIVLVPLLPFFDPDTQDLRGRFLLPFTDSAHLLGTDALGRDMLSRLAVAGRVSLSIAVPAVALNLLIGVTLGLIAGYFGGRLDTVISALSDIQLAIPIMLLLIAIVSAIGPSIVTLIVVIGVANWVGYARVARATAWSLREREFIWAPKTHGATHGWILRKHLVPNVVPALAVLVPFDLGVIVLLEAALSFLGLGIQAPTPSWGGMIEEGQTYLRDSPMITILPGLMLFMLVAGLQFMSQRLTGVQSQKAE